MDYRKHAPVQVQSLCNYYTTYTTRERKAQLNRKRKQKETRSIKVQARVATRGQLMPGSPDVWSIYGCHKAFWGVCPHEKISLTAFSCVNLWLPLRTTYSCSRTHLLTQGYDPELERQLIAIGYDPTIARKTTRFFGLLKGKSPETEEDWEELIDDWDNIWAKD